jgi:hypothetical protein
LRKSLLLTAFLFSLEAPAQFIRTPGSFAYTRFTAYSTRFTDAFSFSGNAGSLAATQTISAGVFSERRFGLKDLSAYAAAFVLPTPSGHFGLRADYLGGASYNESSMGLAYGRDLGSKVALGVQFNYFALTAAGYGAASAINADAGVMIHLTPQLNAGFQACNPVGTSWNKNGTGPLPAIYRAGLGYEASPHFFVSAEAEKTENEPLSINAAMQYTMAEKVVARAGIRSATAVYYLGFGVQRKGFRFDVTASMHPYLGLTPGLSLLYVAGK